MRKFFINIQEVLKPDGIYEHQQILNSLIGLIFKEKTTAESIKLFEALKIDFEKKIAEKGIDSLIEHTTCEEYFDRISKSKQ